MKVEVKVPQMGESISEAVVAVIIKSDGSFVNTDDEILELETDKVNQVLYAPTSGKLSLKINVGDRVTIGQVIGIVDSDQVSKEPTAEKQKNETIVDKKVEKPTEEIKKTPAKKIRESKEEAVKDLIHEEVKPKVKTVNLPEESVKSSKSENNVTRRKMSNIRKVIASRMVEVKNTTAMLTTFNEVDMSAIIALRDKYKEVFFEKYGVKLGFMSFFVKAVVSALEKFPDINSYIEGDEIVTKQFYDIGIAVGTEKGVIVPVVRSCDQLNHPDIELAIEQYAQKARAGSIAIEDLQGGSFTITNGGVFGSMLSTPIINPGQSAILGLHKISKRAVVIDDRIEIRPIMYLALSYDHRIVDGKEAVSFLVQIKNAIEYPASFLLGL